MASKTKDSNLSIEERLEQALIPNWDEPYKLPQNWCWINLKSVLRHQSGNSKLIKGKLSPEKNDGLYDAYSASGQDVYTESYEHEGDAIIVSAVGARCGKAFLASGKWSAIANTHIIYTNDDLLDIRYLYYILNDESWWVKSGSAQPFVVVNQSLLRPFALPPIQEQQRLVKQIETLFSELDEAKEKAQEVIEGFGARKAAILHKAFSGELTAKWREKNKVSFGEWNNKLFDECIEKMQNGLAKRNGSTGVPYVVLRLANLSDDGFITDDLREIVLDEKEQKSYRLNVGDIVMIWVNGSKDNVAKQILVTENNLWAFCDHIIRIKYNESVLPEYMVLYSKSEAYKSYVKDNIVSSAGQNTISRKGMARLSIPVPPIEEQKEIAIILSEIFTKERRVNETAEAVIEQIDTMKKAILARAFRGELGTNNPSEESSLELLKKVLGEGAISRTPTKKPTKRITIPADIKELLSNVREEEIIKLLLKSAPQPVSIQEIMSLSSKKFELMDALRTLEKKQLITKNETGEYSLMR